MNKVQVKEQLDWVVAPPQQESSLNIVVIPPSQDKPYEILEAHWLEQGWRIRHWGNGSMKTLPFSTEKYDYEEYEPAEVNIPREGLQRLNKAYEIVRIRRVIIAHEKDQAIDVPPEPEIFAVPKPDIEKLRERDWSWVKQVAIGVGVIAGIALLVTALPMLLLGAAVVGVAAGDPGVICELEDGTWAEVYYWFPQEQSGH